MKLLLPSRTLATAVALASLVFNAPLFAAEWQFAARDVAYSTAQAETRTLSAFLWIPPACAKIRGLILAQQGVVEQQVVESGAIRQAASEADAAIVFLTPGMDIKLGAAPTLAALNKVMEELSGISGYSEIAKAPWLIFGHSTGGVWALRAAAAAPERTLAVISFKGQVALPELARVPVLTIHGEFYEWMSAADKDFDRRAGISGLIKGMRGVRSRLGGPHALLFDPASSHFDCREKLTEFLALYISKTFAFRAAPKNSAPFALQPVDLSAGWLAENTFPEPAHAMPSPATTFTGDPNNASWYFDQTLATAAENFQKVGEQRSDQMTSFLDASGKVLPLGPQGLVEPLTADFEQDGITFTLRPGFFDSIPPALKNGGQALGHSEKAPQSLKLHGHFESLGANRFRLQPDFTWPNRGGGYYVLAVHPGDPHFRPSIQPGSIPGFEKNTSGQAQQIFFPDIPDQTVGAPGYQLRATSNAGLPVSYFVKAGPAVIEGDRLRITRIPLRSAFPVKVSVVAWQWGRSRDPKVQTAEMVEKSFLITR